MKLTLRQRWSLGCVSGAVAFAFLGVLAGCGSVGDEQTVQARSASGGAAPAGTRWVSAWGAAPYGPFPLGPLTGVAPVDPLALTALTLAQDQQLHDQSLRMIVHPTLGGAVLRIRLSNLVGDRPITFGPIHVDRRIAGPAVLPVGGQPVLFNGKADVTILPGAEAISDATAFEYAVGDDLAISFHVVGDSGPMTWHAVSFGLNYVGPPGVDVTIDPSGASFAPQPTVGWFFISGVDVASADSPGAIAAFGDSITDGAYETPETNTRWPDFLSQRLQAGGIGMSVVNEGINSNTVTRVSAKNPERGPPAVDRFDRDVLGRSGMRALVLFEGTNDLTSGVKAAEVYAGLRDLIGRAHSAGICVVLGTIMPRDDLIFGWDRATMEAERQTLNALIRGDSDVEGIADFDSVMGSPVDPSRPNPAYYSPDLLHPTTLGFWMMANTVPLEALVPPPAGRCSR